MASSKSIIATWKPKSNYPLICKSTNLIQNQSDFIGYFRYDFDRDGYITKEDVRLILSHVPIVNQVSAKEIHEGTFTREGGGK